MNLYELTKKAIFQFNIFHSNLDSWRLKIDKIIFIFCKITIQNSSIFYFKKQIFNYQDKIFHFLKIPNKFMKEL